MSDLAHGLSQRGWAVTVLTATEGKPLPFPVKRLGGPMGAAAGVSVVGKALRGLRFLAGTSLWCLRHGQRGDVVLIVSNPPFIGLLGPLLLRIRGMPYVFLFQDLFPRSAVLSACTVVLSQAMDQRLRREFGYGLPLKVIHNWAVECADATPRQANRFAHDHGFADKFTLQYSGNFGRLHDLLTLLEAARLLQAEPVQFVFIGGGAKQRQIEAWVDVFALPGAPEGKPGRLRPRGDRAHSRRRRYGGSEQVLRNPCQWPGAGADRPPELRSCPAGPAGRLRHRGGAR
jgi:glycosyltransferase involved in cell wall biosynthesis